MSGNTNSDPNDALRGAQGPCGHTDEVAALTARLAAVERERDVYRTALEKLATWQAWARSQDGGGDYIYGCHARCEALGALEEVDPDLDLRTLGYEPEEPTDGR